MRPEVYRIVGNEEAPRSTHVKIYLYRRRRIGAWAPFFVITRTLYRDHVSSRDAQALIDRLNCGWREPTLRLNDADA